MLSFSQFITEGNKLWKNVEQPLSKGKKVGVVSAERYTRTPYWNKQADKSMKQDLDKLRRYGDISGFKRSLGRYQDTEKAPGDIDKEKSYVVRQGSGKKARHFAKILDLLGKRYGQQSTMHISPDKKAEYHYMGDKKKVDSLGKVVYNRKLTGGSGDTSFRKKQSFTTRK